MALTGTDRGSGTHNTAATSFTATPGSNLTAGAMAVMVIASDNAGSVGAAMATFTVTDTKSNTWTRRQSPINDPGSANQGTEGAIFTTPQNGGALTTGDTITVSFGSDTPTAKTWTLMEVTAGAGNTVTYVTGGTGTSGTGTTSPTITTGTITDTNMVIAALFIEAGTAMVITQDGDSTNGSWSAQQNAQIGSGAAGQCVASQRKVVSATATQTYNPTLSASPFDLALAWIELRELVNTTVTPTTATLTIATFAPSVTASDHQTVTPTTASLTTATFAPSVTASDHQTVTPTTATLSTSGFAPTVSVTDHQTVTPDPASLSTVTFAPTVIVASGEVLVTPGVATLTLATFAPAVRVQQQFRNTFTGEIRESETELGYPWMLEGTQLRPPSFELSVKTSDKILAEVGDDPVLAQEALDTELSREFPPRTDLLEALRKVIADAES